MGAAAAVWLLIFPAASLADSVQPGRIIFSYWKTIHEESETPGGKGGVGADTMRGDRTIEVSGHIELALPTTDFDYLAPTLTLPGPFNQPLTMPNPQSFFAAWPDEERAGWRPQTTAYAIRASVSGESDHQHFAMNA